MRKYVIGAIIGIMLSMSFSVSAEVVNMIGKKVDGSFPFKINDQKVNKDVIVIEGMSYIPIRAAADLFGYDIDFDEVNKEVHMQSKKYKGLSDFEKASRSRASYYLKTDVPQLKNSGDDKIEALLYQNEFYVPTVPLFYDVAHWDGTKLTISFNGKTVTGTKDSTENNDAFILDGIFYIKLSILGLKATVQGDTLIIDKQ